MTDEKALMKAAVSGDVATLKRLKHEHRLAWRWVLSMAAKNGHSECVDFILDHACISEDEKGDALIRASGGGHILCVESLTKGRFPIKSRNLTKARNVALRRAAGNGRIEGDRSRRPRGP